MPSYVPYVPAPGRFKELEEEDKTSNRYTFHARKRRLKGLREEYKRLPTRELRDRLNRAKDALESVPKQPWSARKGLSLPNANPALEDRRDELESELKKRKGKD